MSGCHCFLFSFSPLSQMVSYFPQVPFYLLVCLGITLMLGILFKGKVTLIFLLIFKRKH